MGRNRSPVEVSASLMSQFDELFRQGHEGVVTAVGGWVRTLKICLFWHCGMQPWPGIYCKSLGA